MHEDYVIEMLNIRKEFPGIVANDDITLQLRRGEIHALLGENGAGKSTLMKILMGIYQRDEGEIYLNGTPEHFASPRQALEKGIAMIHQELNLIARSGWVMGTALIVAGVILFLLFKKSGKKVALVFSIICGVLGLLGLLQGLGILSGVPILALGLPAVLSCYFDLFSGFIQAYVFSLLTMVYISGSLPEPKEAEQ